MRTELVAATPEGIQRVAQALGQNQVCALPTETVYGLAGLAHSPEALARIFAAKERPHFDPLIVHVSTRLKTLAALDAAGVTDSRLLSDRARERAESLMRLFWPGPLTLVLPKHASIPDLATSGLPTVGVRMPSHPVFQDILAQLGKPLAAPSANRFGRISPTEAEHARDELDGRIPLVLDGGACEVGVESTIVAITPEGDLRWLRPGKIGQAEIGEALGIPFDQILVAESSSQPAAPGMLDSHYAPRKPLLRLECAWEEMSGAQSSELVDRIAGRPWALLHWGRLPTSFGRLAPPAAARSLSAESDASMAAQNLFGALRALDESAAQVLVSTGAPITRPDLALQSLRAAIEDRLTRASERAIRDARADAARAAVLEAWPHMGATSPNPPVGAAILDAEGNLLAVAAHARAGAPHAEALAIRDLRLSGDLDRARTLLVTLEPCDHQGKTGPCSDAILETSIREVLYAQADPNPKATGGAQKLAQRGLHCRTWAEAGLPASLTEAARQLNAPFAKWVSTGMPWVVVKSAINAQGTMVPPPGRKTFTSPASLLLAHRLRRESDAILTGSGTILADVPEFTVRRLPDHAAAQLRAKPRKLVILDRRGWVSEAYRKAAATKGFEVLWIRDPIEPAALLKDLAKAGVVQVLVEAGPTLRDAILSEGLWDRHVIIRQSKAQPEDPEIIEDVYRNR